MHAGLLRIVLCLIVSLLFVYPIPLQADEKPLTSADVERIIERVDRLFRSATSFSRMEMEIQTPDWSRTLSMDVWTRDLNHTLISITGPKKDLGIATLRVENEMWNFFPRINKVMKVPPSMMMSSWMGSDFTNDDLVKESSMIRDYTLTLLEDPDPAHWRIRLVPKENTPIVWSGIIVTVRKADDIPVLQEFFDEDGKKMREIRFEDIRPLGGRTIPTVLELVPLNKEGHRTVIRYLEADFDIPLAEDTFSLRNLRKRR